MGLVEELKPAGHIIKRFEVFAPNGKSTRDVITVRDGLPDYAMVVPRFTLDEHIRNRAVQSGANFMNSSRPLNGASKPSQ